MSVLNKTVLDLIESGVIYKEIFFTITEMTLISMLIVFTGWLLFFKIPKWFKWLEGDLS